MKLGGVHEVEIEFDVHIAATMVEQDTYLQHHFF
jgi:hypothetical protein